MQPLNTDTYRVLWPDVLPCFTATNATVPPALCYGGQLSSVTISNMSHVAYSRVDQWWSNPTNTLLLRYRYNSTPFCPEILWFSGLLQYPPSATTSWKSQLCQGKISLSFGVEICHKYVITAQYQVQFSSQKTKWDSLKWVLLQTLQNLFILNLTLTETEDPIIDICSQIDFKKICISETIHSFMFIKIHLQM